jgi:predicted glycogen debranching enzyme
MKTEEKDFTDVPVRSIKWPSGECIHADEYLRREWLVTNGLGGYASGTVMGIPTRRYHGYLIAALKAPFGRTVMLNNLFQSVVFPDGAAVNICGQERGPELSDAVPSEFKLEMRFAVWKYRIRDAVLERKVFMSYRQNTVHISYRISSGADGLKLRLSPGLHFRRHESPVTDEFPAPYLVTLTEEGIELHDRSELPPLRIKALGAASEFVLHSTNIEKVFFRLEQQRGYEAYGKLWSPGYFNIDLNQDTWITFIASTESWDVIRALPPADAFDTEWERRRMLIGSADRRAQKGLPAELVLSSDQFIFTAVSRPEDEARALAAGEEFRSIIAGYHWFTDWGRDTMISLEGLTLITGRSVAAGWILRTYAHYLRNGLVPNMFPEGEKDGMYNTADATLWFFHAIGRYLHYEEDEPMLRLMLPKLIDIVDRHIRGTDFGIRVDPDDGLLSQGDPNWPLTWMDAMVGGWIVTPRRGKTVEINALWYNALRLLEDWIRKYRDEKDSIRYRQLADRVYESFNAKFWYGPGGYLYDIVDGEQGNDSSCRPNQLFPIALTHPVLDPVRWPQVLDKVEKKLLTPVGLRSLSPDNPEYKPKYDGDRRARDAAYHQGTVWGWLIGPFVDAWLKLHPGELRSARKFLEGLVPHMNEACIGSMSEVFDAEPPYTPRGCIAQAWTVAEFLRAWVKTEQQP